MKKEDDECIDDLKWEFLPPLPVPNLFSFKLEITKDLKEIEDISEVENDYKHIYTNVLELDPLEELYREEKNLNCLKENKSIDSNYYLNQSERSEIFTRHEQQAILDEIIDFENFTKNSFKTVEEYIQKNTKNDENDENDIIESYPLFPDKNENLVMISGLTENLENDKLEIPLSAVGTVNINKKTHRIAQQKVENYICINIKDGKAYYSNIKYIYKIN